MQPHPQVEALLKIMADAGAKPYSECSLDEARDRPSAIVKLTGPGPEMAEQRDLTVTTNEAALPARLYRPVAGAVPALIVYFHGGGWMVGEIDHFDGICRRLAHASGCDLLSIGYRLAPEHPFPAAVGDALGAMNWAAAELADGRPLILAGDSSGGNLATVAARKARDAGEPTIALQVLVYPVTDHDFDRGSYGLRGDGSFGLAAADMRSFWDAYLPDPGARADPDASPLRAGDLSGLAPALVIVAEFDPLRDEGLAYARRLSEAGVVVTLRHYDDVNHGFFTMAGFLDRGDDAVAEIAAAIAAAVETDGSC